MIKDPVTRIKPLAICINSGPQSAPVAPDLTPSEEGSSLMSELAEDYCQLKRWEHPFASSCAHPHPFSNRTPTPQEELDYRSQSTLKSRIQDSPLGVKRHHLFRIFKWSLAVSNGLMILFVLYGIYSHFSDIRDKANFSFTSMEKSFPGDFKSFASDGPGLSAGPKYTWVVSMFVFALLLTIPCIGFVGAMKEHTCLLIFYGVIFFVNAFVILMFRSPLCLIPAFLSSAALGLVFLIQKPNSSLDSCEEETSKDASVEAPKYRKWAINEV